MELGNDRARDHDHLTGKYKSAAHSNYNLQLQFRKAKQLNSNYSKFGKFKDRKLTCVPNNMEKYISFSLDNLRFIDSYQFRHTCWKSGYRRERKISNTNKSLCWWITKTVITSKRGISLWLYGSWTSLRGNNIISTRCLL